MWHSFLREKERCCAYSLAYGGANLTILRSSQWQRQKDSPGVKKPVESSSIKDWKMSDAGTRGRVFYMQPSRLLKLHLAGRCYEYECIICHFCNWTRSPMRVSDTCHLFHLQCIYSYYDAFENILPVIILHAELEVSRKMQFYLTASFFGKQSREWNQILVSPQICNLARHYKNLTSQQIACKSL